MCRKLKKMVYVPSKVIRLLAKNQRGVEFNYAQKVFDLKQYFEAAL